MYSQLGRARLGRLQLGALPPITSATAVFRTEPTLVLVTAGGTPASRYAGVLGIARLGQFELGRTIGGATAGLAYRAFLGITAAPVAVFVGAAGGLSGIFVASANPTASATGRLGKGFVATASPTSRYYSGGLFTATASPTAGAFLRIPPSFVGTAEAGLLIFQRAGQPGTCIAGPNAPPAERPPNSAL